MSPTLDLDTLTLAVGAHEPNSGGAMCVMEAVAYVAGEPWSDRPRCASPILGAPSIPRRLRPMAFNANTLADVPIEDLQARITVERICHTLEEQTGAQP